MIISPDTRESRFSMIYVTCGLTLLHRPGSSGQWSLTRSWRLLLDGFPGACPSPRDHSLHEHAPSRSGEPPPSPGHIPRAKHAPAPSHAARCRCPLLVHAPRYPPLTFGRTWRAKREASHNDPAAIDIYFLSCACSCSLMLVAMLVCGAGARNVCCMRM